MYSKVKIRVIRRGYHSSGTVITLKLLETPSEIVLDPE